MDNDTIRSTVLEAMEVSLSAQLKAIRLLRTKKIPLKKQDGGSGFSTHVKSRSHIDMAFDILAEANTPLHVTDIISCIAERFGIRIDRESLVSALTKKVARQDRFIRTAKNTFALIDTLDTKTSRS